MIQLSRIEVRGRAAAGEFSRILEVGPGLQVISAHNAFGKSLAVKSVAWCLGLGTMFGSADNDPIMLPEAVRESLDLDGHPNTPVISSECAIWIEDEGGRRLEVRRDIKGEIPPWSRSGRRTRARNHERASSWPGNRPCKMRQGDSNGSYLNG